MDDDDLLGGPSTAVARHADPFDDDLLGGGGAGPALDDDLLFGGPSQATPASSAASTGAAATAARAPPPVQYATAPRRAIPVGSIKETSPSLAPFLTPNSFFLRYAMVIDAEGKRSRRVITLSDAKIYVVRENTTVERDIPISHTIGVITQNITVAKRIGSSKESELHVLVQLGGSEPDLLFSLHKDDHNFTATQQGEFCSVLSAILSAYDIVLHVALLPQTEKIQDYVKTNAIDDRLRRQLCEALAYRSELQREQMELANREAQLEMSVASLRGSQSGQAAADILEEIRKLEAVIAEFGPKMNEIAKDRVVAMKSLDQVNLALQNESRLRNEQLRVLKEEASKKHLLEQVREYELQKAAHKRELDKLSQLTALYERRVKERGAGTFGIAQLPLRIDDLDEQLMTIRSKINERSEEHSRRVKVLAENRRRAATAKDLLAHLPTEIDLLQKLSPSESIPTGVTDTTLPDTTPLLFVSNADDDAKTAKSPAPAAAKSASAEPPSAAAPISPDLPPAKPPAAKPPAVSLEDDI